MQYATAATLIAFFGLSSAAPMPKAAPVYTLRGREVPQEHSHNGIIATVNTNLKSTNTANIQDAIFGLLGNAAAAAGAGTITNLDCLHQATADQAFTNAKAAGDVSGQVSAMIYATLERNTGSVGLASVECNETAANPEIAALSQHQDPASTGAAATNKAIVLELAKQITNVGGDPLTALVSGTFQPGTLGDPTAAGHTCDTVDDDIGCIISQNLLVPDATPAEISSAVAGLSVSPSASSVSVAGAAQVLSMVGAGGAGAAGGAAVATTTSAAAVAANTGAASSSDCPAVVTATVTSGASGAAATTPAAAASSTGASSAAASSADASSTSTTASGTNVQTFTGSLGGAPPPVIETAGSDRPFSVKGDTFVNIGAALQRSCSVQHNTCANAVNSGSLSGSSVADCETQEDACNAAASTTSA